MDLEGALVIKVISKFSGQLDDKVIHINLPYLGLLITLMASKLIHL